MGMDLRGKGGAFRFSRSGWSYVLALAYGHGWKPEGTKPHTEIFRDLGVSEEKWDGDYFMDVYQKVTDQDARNLSKALKKALPEVEKEKGEEWGKYIEDFSMFCDEGGFCIG